VCFFRPFDHQKLRQYVNDDPFHPERHFVSVGLAVMQVENENGQQDTKIDQNQSEKQIFAKQWYDKRGGRYELDQKQVKHKQGDENRYAKC
jgi:hypothetical protein